MFWQPIESDLSMFFGHHGSGLAFEEFKVTLTTVPPTVSDGLRRATARKMRTKRMTSQRDVLQSLEPQGSKIKINSAYFGAYSI